MAGRNYTPIAPQAGSARPDGESRTIFLSARPLLCDFAGREQEI
jgi:hypothetical protein